MRERAGGEPTWARPYGVAIAQPVREATPKPVPAPLDRTVTYPHDDKVPVSAPGKIAHTGLGRGMIDISSI